jgi:hypothetical protein
MTVQCRKGDIFEVKLDDGRKRYFQFVCRDLEQLNSDVIRVFKKVYLSDESPLSDMIISDEVDQYVHTSVYAGVKLGFWVKYGKSSNVGNLDVYFRDARDFGREPEEPLRKKISYQWDVWKINERRFYVGKLPERYYCAYQGMVEPPFLVAECIRNCRPIEGLYDPVF